MLMRNDDSNGFGGNSFMGKDFAGDGFSADDLAAGQFGGHDVDFDGIGRALERERERHLARDSGLGRNLDGSRKRVRDVAADVDRWTEEQMFEEDLRAVLTMLRPNRRERLMGWSEYRTGGANFRATIAWDPKFEGRNAPGATRGAGEAPDNTHGRLAVPHMADVLEAILVGSAKHEDEMPAAEEFELYRDVVRELYRRLDEMERCYE